MFKADFSLCLSAYLLNGLVSWTDLYWSLHNVKHLHTQHCKWTHGDICLVSGPQTPSSGLFMLLQW